MTSIKTLWLLTAIWLFACSQKNVNQKTNPVAIELNKQAMVLVPYIKNADSSLKAISLLDSATTLDSNYFSGYYNKLMFLGQQKQYDKAIVAIQSLTRIQPLAHDLYLTGGMLYESTGDSISSKKYFQKSLAICNMVLDTMSVSHRDYEMMVGNKAANLIMLGHPEQAKEVLQKLYDSIMDEELKSKLLLLMKKSRSELLTDFIESK